MLPAHDEKYLTEKGYKYELVKDANGIGLVIKNWEVPTHKYNMATTDLLILLPPGYPDTPIDMFYCNPPLLLNGNKYPKAADVPYSFNGISWQRWSRHRHGAEAWRPGIDGINTHLQIVKTAIERAE